MKQKTTSNFIQNTKRQYLNREIQELRRLNGFNLHEKSTKINAVNIIPK
jgi:hypothetical protein